MNKKFLSAILFGALMVTSTGTFVSCKDYDDDIDQINTELADLKDQIAALQSKVNSGEWVSGVTTTADGITVTLGNGQSFNIKNGAAGAKGDKGDQGEQGVAGENGKTPKIAVNNEIIQVSYDDGATWTDLVALADLKGAAGEAAAEPIFSVGEDGHIYVQMGEEGEKKDLGVSTGGIYYVEDGPSIVLHICDENGEWNDVVLPRTAGISSITALTIGTGNKVTNGASVNVTYTIASADGKYLDGTEFEKGDVLTSVTSKVTAQVNPTMADASLYDFYLADSKGASIFALGTAVANMTDGALSRAASANKGVYDMPIEIVAGTSEKAIKATSGVAYAIATKDAYDNEILSNYDVKVNVAKATTSSLTVPSTPILVTVGEDYDFVAEGDVTLENVVDVNYYFAKGETAAVEAAGASLNGSVISGTKVGKTVEVTVDWLDHKGDKQTAKTFKVKFIAPATENAYTLEITPTGDADEDVVTFDLTSIFGKSNATNGATVVAMKYAAEVKDKNNDTKYAKGADVVGITEPASVAAKKNDEGYWSHTATYSVDAAKVIPGTYEAVIEYGSNPTNTVTLTIVVNDPAASFEFKPLDLYFSGNNATAYGKPSNDKIEYNLKGLFGVKDADWNYISFSETVPEDYEDADGIKWSANEWLADATSGNIKVDKVKSADKTAKVGNFGGAYEARAMKATYQPFNNKNFDNVPYEFNLTIKSAVYEGTLTYVKPTANYDADGNFTHMTYPAGTAKSISVVGTDPKTTLKANEILGKTKTGVSYFADRVGVESLIEVIGVALEGETAEQYLEAPTGDWTSGWTIKVKANVTAPADGKTVTCYVRVSVLDQWGKVKTVDVPVTLK